MAEKSDMDPVELLGAPPGETSLGSVEDDLIHSIRISNLPRARAAAQRAVEKVLDGAVDHFLASHVLYEILCRVGRTVADLRGMARSELRERQELVHQLVSAQSAPDLRMAFLKAFAQECGRLEASAPDGHPAVEQVRSFIRRNYKRKMSLSEISRAAGVSRNYLSHLFKRHSGMTVTEFLHRTRIQAAEELLRTGNGTVSEIAYVVGYQNYRDFHRNFVRHARTSPKRYRQAGVLGRRPSAPSPR